ncbi:glycosyltransferase [Streptomyces sp. NPDC014646]|uniref:glycosyltransferase n=1 Tax=Streptomyces sp. NPDC014646 TaxID=3364877 RepID=UPI0036FF68E0
MPDPRVRPADGRSRIVMAAGRLVPEKRFDLLVQAFAQVVAVRPDWQLRIYGTGPEYGRLRALVAELELYNHVFLMMEEPRLEARWAGAAIAAGASERTRVPTAPRTRRSGSRGSSDRPVGPAGRAAPPPRSPSPAR